MELPQRYGHYVLLERIAVGGMGEIFRAKYAGLAGFERACAIKRILPHLSDDPEFVDRLISEAMIAVQLSHTNIVQVYELGKIENEYFIAMEWVDGPDLSTLQVRAKAKDIPMPLPLAIHVVHEVARALDHAHRKSDAEGKNLQIVHRDISPQNVMLTLDGAVKLGDFGIARAGGIARRFATGMGAVLGKRRYMSPEQRRGENVDARTDVYALGALLFEGVTGNAPDPESPIPLLSTLAKDVTPELDAICAKSLAFDSNDRTSTAAELAEGLERVFVRLASASTSRAVRDPGPELGRFVRKVCPPGEKLPQKRSLTSRIRAAMPRAAKTMTPGSSTPNLTQAAPNATPSADMQSPPHEIASLDLPHGADGVTLVRSAIIPAALPDSAASKAATVAKPAPSGDELDDALGTATLPKASGIAVMPAAPSPMPTMTASKPVREDETVLDAARPPSDIDTDRGPSAKRVALSSSTGDDDGTETVPVVNADLVRASKPSNAETLIQPHPDLVRPSRGSQPREAPDLAATSAAETMTAPAVGASGSRSETIVAPLLPTGAPPARARANGSDPLANVPTSPQDPRDAARSALGDVPTAPPDQLRGSRSAIEDDPSTAPRDLSRGSRSALAANATTAPPDLVRGSRSSSVVEVRRGRGPSSTDDGSRGDEDLFPPDANRRGSAAPLFAGAGAMLFALLAIALWGSGVFHADPGSSVATPIAGITPPATIARVTPTKRVVTTPERTPTPRPTPERTPQKATPTATPVKTRVALAPTPVPTPKATSRPAGFGTLVVNAKPWARVFVDGRDVGQTPVKGLRLASGTYKVVLEHPSFGRIERSISLTADETEKVIVDFKSLPGEPGPGSP